MKKLLIVFASLFLLTGCGSKVSTMESDDGEVTLEVPKDALPEGVELSDLSVTAVNGSEDAIVYELEPDGTQFSEDLTLTTTIDLKEGIIPEMYLVSNDKIEPIKEADIIIDQEKGTTTVKAKIPHFSRFVMREGARFSYGAEATGGFIGDPVAASASVSFNYEPRTVQNSGHSPFTVNMVPESVTVRGTLSSDSKIFDPDRSFRDTPPLTTVYDTFTVPGDKYSCEKKGVGWIEFNLLFHYTDKIDGVSEWFSDSIRRIEIFTTAECKELPRCGDGVADPNEECDGIDLKGKTCLDLGFKDPDFLLCRQCEFYTDECKIIHELSCNENTWDDQRGEWEHWTCQDDCPEGKQCSPACKCEEPYEEVLMKYIFYREYRIPVDQIHEWTGEECDKEAHWHSNGPTVTTIEGVVLEDPDPGSCGFGKVKSHPAIETLVRVR